jgi:hypothetical protein
VAEEVTNSERGQTGDVPRQAEQRREKGQPVVQTTPHHQREQHAVQRRPDQESDEMYERGDVVGRHAVR